MDDYEYSTIELVIGSITIFISLVSLTGSIITLWLIKSLKNWNGYISLIFALTVCQIFYDLSFFFIPFYNYPICVILTTFLSSFGGLATNLWTNAMSVIIYYVVEELQFFDIPKYFYKIAIIIVSPSLIFGIIAAVYDFSSSAAEITNLFYYSTRIVCTAFNLIMYLLISRKLNKMGFFNQSKSEIYEALLTLVGRIRYYPLCQTTYIIGAAIYYSAFGFDGLAGHYKSQSSQVFGACALFVYGACNAIAGLGYFIIYLTMQPSAFLHLKSHICPTFIQRYLDSSSATDSYMLCDGLDGALISERDTGSIGSHTSKLLAGSDSSGSALLILTVGIPRNGSSIDESNSDNSKTGKLLMDYSLWTEDELMTDIETKIRLLRSSLDRAT